MAKVSLFLGSFERRLPKPQMRRHKNIIDITKLVRKRDVSASDAANLQKVILVDIMEADFRCSEATRFQRYIEAFRRGNTAFQKDHTVAMINRSYKIIEFFIAESKINNTVILDTRRWRMLKGGSEHWDDDNIVYYAAQCGFELIVPSRKTISEIMYIVEAA